LAMMRDSDRGRSRLKWHPLSSIECWRGRAKRRAQNQKAWSNGVVEYWSNGSLFTNTPILHYFNAPIGRCSTLNHKYQELGGLKWRQSSR
jgi:hypothetical protein